MYYVDLTSGCTIKVHTMENKERRKEKKENREKKGEKMVCIPVGKVRYCLRAIVTRTEPTMYSTAAMRMEGFLPQRRVRGEAGTLHKGRKH